MILSILILSIPERQNLLLELCNEFYRQIDGYGVKLFCDDRIGVTKGEKRNYCLQNCTSEYFAFFDDDDWPEPCYIKEVLKGLTHKPDCTSLRGLMTTDGLRPEIFEHSLKYPAWKTDHSNAIVHERTPNHLNAMRTDIGKQFKFPHTDHGEDHVWSAQIAEAELANGTKALKTEYYIDKIIYNYRFNSNK